MLFMKKITTTILFCMLALYTQAYTPWTKGAFETQQYRNVFVEMGYEPSAVEAKLKEVMSLAKDLSILLSPERTSF